MQCIALIGAQVKGGVLKERRQESVRGQYMVTHDLRGIEM